MELLLNLVWGVLALIAFGLYARRHRTDGPRASRLRPILALACGVVLLFPIISASDDLHAADIAVEDSVKRLCVGLSAPSTSGHLPLAFLPFLLATLLLMGVLRFENLAALLMVPKPASLVVTPSEGRAPPVQL